MRKTDVFHAFLIEDAPRVGKYGFPPIQTTFGSLPQKLIPFDKSGKTLNYDQWIHFYQDDSRYNCVWNNPQKYLNRFQKFQGIISTDFSLYWNMPLADQINSVRRNRYLAYWYLRNGVSVIPNVRWGDEYSYDFCFDGIQRNSVVAIGSHGAIRNKEYKTKFQNGLNEMMKRLTPHTILVYGYTPNSIFFSIQQQGVRILSFENDIVQTRKVHE